MPSHASPYFIRRSPPDRGDFEESYWGVVRDPDGVVRDRLSERDRHVADVQDELYHINQLPPGRILDVGCGLGYVLSGVDSRWEKHGVELSQFAAEHARAYARVHTGDLQSAAYPDSHFDAVILYHVVEHMVDPVTELREIRRVLKPGGCIVVATPNFDSACARRFGSRFRMLCDLTHISLFSETSLRQLLIDEGFDIDRVEFPYFETPHFNSDNLERLKDASQISPAFYGNIMTFYGRKNNSSPTVAMLARTGRLLHRIATEQETQCNAASDLFAAVVHRGGQMVFAGAGATRHVAQLDAAGFRVQAYADSLPLTIGANDLLVITANESIAPELLVTARRRKIPTLALLGEGAPDIAEAEILRIPSDASSYVEAAQYFINLVLGLTTGALQTPQTAA